MIADDIDPQQQPVSQSVKKGRKADEQAQEANRADVGGRTRYQRRERRVPARFKDFEMGEGENE